MASLIIDAVQAVGVASATVVSVELTDQRGDPVVGFVTAGNEVIVLPATTTTDVNGQAVIDLVPNADITPGNTCYTVRIAGKQFLIQKSAVPQGLFDALVTEPGELDPIEANDLQDHINDPTNAHFATAIGFQPYLGLLSDNTQDAIEELYDQAIVGLDDASEINFTPTGDIVATNVQDAIVEVDAELHSHESDPTAAHNASAIAVVPFDTIGSTDVQGALEEIMDEIVTTAADTTFVPAGDIVATNVQAAIEEVDAELHAHEADTVDAHDASAISFAPASGITSTNAQDAIVEAKTDSTGYTDAHISDPTAAHAASAVSFSPANVLDATDVQSALVELGESFSTPKTPSGFPNTTDTTIAIVDAGADLTFTIAPVGASFDVWLFGDKHTKTSESVSTPDGLDRVYYFYYDSAGTLSVVTNAVQPLGFDWPTQVPIAIAFRNSSGNDLVLFDTRHGLSMDWATRGYLHSTRGTQYGSGLVLSGYTLSPGAPVDADNTWGLSAGTVQNEDLTYTIPAITDGSTYTTLYKSGSLPTFTSATSFGIATPFATVAGDLAYNLNTAGSYSLAAVPNGSFVNYLIFVTGSQTAGYKTFAFPEETVYATQALAEAAAIASPFTAGGFAYSEFFMRYRVTYQRSNAYTTTGRCRTVAVTQITNSQTLITAGATPSSHGSLTGRDAADQHPASSITFTPAQGIAATNVQSAIEEAVTDTVAGFVPKDGSYAATTTSVVKSRVTADANPRWETLTDGTHQWGNGSAVADTNLYRSGANVLKTDDSLHVTNQVGIGIAPSASAALTLPTGTTSVQGILFDGDTNLYRSAADTLKTDDSLHVGVGLRLSTASAGTTQANGIIFGSGADVNLYRQAADVLRTDDRFQSFYSETDPPSDFINRFVHTQTMSAGSSANSSTLEVSSSVTGGSANHTGFLTSAFFVAGVSGSYTGTMSNAISMQSRLTTVSGSTINTAVGWNITTASGTGTVSSATGLNVNPFGPTGSTTTQIGIRVFPQTAVTSGYGVMVDASPTQTLWISSNANNTTAAAGIAFGSSRDTNLYRSAADTLKTDDKLITVAGLGVGNSAAATTPGSVTRKIEVFDASGASLGFIPVYSTIT